jgi:type IX secretion system PorP/SprF family membrane protein
MKRYILILILLCSKTTIGQQLPQFSQYFLNDFALNPAIAGRSNYFDARFTNRYQWVGITDAPKTFIMTLHGPIAAQNMGIGAKMYADVTGPTRKVGAGLSYAYHFKITSELKLSFGLQAGFVNYALDGSKIVTKEVADPLMSSFYQSVFLPDVAFGLHLYHEKFFFTASAPQLLQARTDFYRYGNTSGRLEDHYFVGGGYTFDLNEEWKLQPLVFMKYVNPTPPIIDFSAKVSFREEIWAALSYRTRDAISIILGYNYMDNLMIGYSYDYTLSQLVNYNSGTHEIMMALRFKTNKPKKLND